ncbi:cold shock and DUF1294 domain-containing protein [Homoserinibacter sp. GY 40078]|uniref:DUF1294 domain-containing protein n=1 Tax=Homoserinibacter sp. GY 40078 TaxID=2603275 RepID=UPI0011CB41BC|nr:cold shock and DUF1294 domain-containing protein [Homoserinibacter sp. GY 40078]TXK17629.1 DUF1294 domain-containing protein [Homoserinibacter sp. GY 40078]
MKPGPARMRGVLTSWNDERGYGFVAPEVGGTDVFVHISAFPVGAPRPQPGDVIAYELALSAERRPRASHAERLGGSAPPVSHGAEGRRAVRMVVPSRRAGRLGYVVVLGFLVIALLVTMFVHPLPLWVGVLYGGMSAVTFLAYALDKRAAVAEGWRIAEGSLLALGLAGGWPGAILAQQLFRHKTVKASFQAVFWVTVVVNVLAFVVFAWFASLDLGV